MAPVICNFYLFLLLNLIYYGISVDYFIEAKKSAKNRKLPNELTNQLLADRKLISLLQAEPLESCGFRPALVTSNNKHTIKRNKQQKRLDKIFEPYENEFVRRVKLGEFPSFGFIWPNPDLNPQLDKDSTWGNECGGVLIGKRSVLASTTCINYLIVDKEAELVVQFGQIDGNITRYDKSKTKNRYKIERVCTDKRMCFNGYLHNGYSMALLKLSSDVEYNDLVQPVCLPFGLTRRGEEEEEEIYLAHNPNDTYLAIGRGSQIEPAGNPLFKLTVNSSTCPGGDQMDLNKQFGFNETNNYMQHPTIDCYSVEPTKVCIAHSGGGVYYERNGGKQQFLAGQISAKLFENDCYDKFILHTIDVNNIMQLRDSLLQMATESPKCYSILDHNARTMDNLQPCQNNKNDWIADKITYRKIG